jgi:hypothetical protein
MPASTPWSVPSRTTGIAFLFCQFRLPTRALALGQGRNAFIEVTKLPKHIQLEGRAAGPIDIIRRTVKKALPKFSGRGPSIVFITDDCFVNLGEWGWGPPQMALLQNSSAYGPGLFHLPDYATIGAVCLFWEKAQAGQNGIEYNIICAANPNAMCSAKIPEQLLNALHR